MRELTPTSILTPTSTLVDKLVTIRREKVGNTIGRLSGQNLLELNRLLALVIGLA